MGANISWAYTGCVAFPAAAVERREGLGENSVHLLLYGRCQGCLNSFASIKPATNLMPSRIHRWNLLPADCVNSCATEHLRLPFRPFTTPIHLANSKAVSVTPFWDKSRHSPMPLYRICLPHAHARVAFDLTKSLTS